MTTINCYSCKNKLNILINDLWVDGGFKICFICNEKFCNKGDNKCKTIILRSYANSICFNCLIDNIKNNYNEEEFLQQFNDLKQEYSILKEKYYSPNGFGAKEAEEHFNNLIRK